jgi:hypothetical protein
VDGELVNNDEVSGTGHCVVSPLGTLLLSEGSKEAGQDHDKVGNNSHEDVDTTQTSKEGKIHEQEWGGNAPIDVTGPVDLARDAVVELDAVLVLLVLGLGVERDTVTDSHGEVGDGSKGGDEGSQDVEEAFLLRLYQYPDAKNTKFNINLQLEHGRPWRRKRWTRVP